MIGISYLWKLLRNDENKKLEISNKICLGLSFFSVIFYVYSLGATYVSNFSEYEAVRLASYPRYMNIAYLMMAIIILECIYHYSRIFENSGMINIIFVAFILTISPMGIVENYLSRDTVRTAQSTRNRYEPLHHLIIKNCSGKDKIYFISEADKGFDYWVTHFNARPNSFSQNFSWSLGEPQFEGDIWTSTSIETSEDWMKVLEDGEYTFIALYNVNDYFKEHYSEIFSNPSDIDNSTLFKLDTKTGLFVKCN